MLVYQLFNPTVVTLLVHIFLVFFLIVYLFFTFLHKIKKNWITFENLGRECPGNLGKTYLLWGNLGKICLKTIPNSFSRASTYPLVLNNQVGDG
jgi:hypothetical protein